MNVERPRSGYARKKNVIHSVISQPVYVDRYSARAVSDDGFQEPEYEPIERPPTSRRHRKKSYDHEVREVDEVYDSPTEQYDSYGSQPFYSDRPQTARSRRRHSTHTQSALHAGYDDEGTIDLDSSGFDRQISDSPVSSRPGTASLSKYAVLPAIGNRRPSAHLQRETTFVHPDTTEKRDQNQRSPPPPPKTKHQQRKLSSASSADSVDRNQNTPLSEEEELHSSSWHVDELQRQISSISLGSREDGVEVILLAVKLPSGERIQGQFRSSDKLSTVASFGEKYSKMQFKGCSLVCHHPHAVYSDLNITIRESGLLSRTVLYIETE